ncbi:MAG: hypothetical protein EOP67_12265, partial [Sphingomonas sp.]
MNYLVNRAAVRSRLSRIPPFRQFRARASAARRNAFRPQSASGTVADTIASTVSQAGVCLLPDISHISDAAGAVVRELVAEGASSWHWPAGRDLLETDDILAQRPSVYHLGFEPTLLDAAERHLCEPCFYMGCSLKRERVDASNDGPRQWHRDIEDDRLFRVIIYLNDVDIGGGPFEFIEAEHSRVALETLRYKSGYVADAAMDAVVPADRWTSVKGAAGSMIAFDGTRVFHRVCRPTAADRFSLSITYSSRHPLQILRQVR